MNAEKCESCGIGWEHHLGPTALCVALRAEKETTKALKEAIATLQREHLAEVAKLQEEKAKLTDEGEGGAMSRPRNYEELEEEITQMQTENIDLRRRLQNWLNYVQTFLAIDGGDTSCVAGPVNTASLKEAAVAALREVWRVDDAFLRGESKIEPEATSEGGT